jgi:excisionase family DNA binding protein
MSALLTRDELCSELRLSKTKVDELLRRGELMALRIGRAVRCPRSSLDAYIQKLSEQRNGEGA